MGGGSRSTRPYIGGGSSTAYNRTLNDFQSTLSEKDTETKKVFISYSMRDKSKVELLKYQLNNDKYELEFIDTSLQNPVKNGSWKPVVGGKIEQSDAVLCMVGDDTHSRTAVAWEVNAAYKTGKTVIPVKIHKNKNCKMPKPIVREGSTSISWKLEDIQSEINAA